jgi:membrane-associated protease RseP (regulator of RpoE activity)
MSNVTYFINAPLSKLGNSYEHNAKSLSTDNATFTTGICSDLSIGPFEFTDVPVSISSAEKGLFSSPGFMGILGNEVLKRFNLFINVKQQRISLEPNRLYPVTFEVNSSGLELISDDSLKKVVVDYVYPDSPADSSGLRAGDQILEINGKRITPAELPEIRSILSQSGSTVAILAARKHELFKFTLRLQRLI